MELIVGYAASALILWGLWKLDRRRLKKFLDRKAKMFVQAVVDDAGEDEEALKRLIAGKFLEFRKL